MLQPIMPPPATTTRACVGNGVERLERLRPANLSAPRRKRAAALGRMRGTAGDVIALSPSHTSLHSSFMPGKPFFEPVEWRVGGAAWRAGSRERQSDSLDTRLYHALPVQLCVHRIHIHTQNCDLRAQTCVLSPHSLTVSGYSCSL